MSTYAPTQNLIALADPTPFERRVRQLSERSVSKYYQAFTDIDWEAHPIDPRDPRFEFDPDHPLATTDWYRDKSPEERAVIGLDFVTASMKIGIVFENVLQRGLLQLAMAIPDRDPSFRYAYHEVIEEAQHSLMFQEFIDRSTRPSATLSPGKRVATHFVANLGRRFPELFMLFVLGGEEPIDREQRRALKQRRTIHPLVARIMQIHVTEEARHLCFARSWLTERVPQLSNTKRWALRLTAPLLLGFMARTMLEPPRSLVKRYAIPPEVIDLAYRNNPTHRKSVRDALSGVRSLCDELDLIRPFTRQLWRWAI